MSARMKLREGEGVHWRKPIYCYICIWGILQNLVLGALFLLRYDTPTAKSTLFTHSSMSFDRCIQLCNHQHNHDIEHCQYPKNLPCVL